MCVCLCVHTNSDGRIWVVVSCLTDMCCGILVQHQVCTDTKAIDFVECVCVCSHACVWSSRFSVTNWGVSDKYSCVPPFHKHTCTHTLEGIIFESIHRREDGYAELKQQGLTQEWLTVWENKSKQMEKHDNLRGTRSEPCWTSYLKVNKLNENYQHLFRFHMFVQRNVF